MKQVIAAIVLALMSYGAQAGTWTCIDNNGTGNTAIESCLNGTPHYASYKIGSQQCTYHNGTTGILCYLDRTSSSGVTQPNASTAVTDSCDWSPGKNNGTCFTSGSLYIIHYAALSQ